MMMRMARPADELGQPAGDFVPEVARRIDDGSGHGQAALFQAVVMSPHALE
jgi:hypothetical protein